MHMWNGLGGWNWMMGLMGLIWIALIVLGFYLVYVFINGKGARRSDPLDILKERLARGEITEEEYDRLKEKLSE